MKIPISKYTHKNALFIVDKRRVEGDGVVYSYCNDGAVRYWSYQANGSNSYVNKGETDELWKLDAGGNVVTRQLESMNGGESGWWVADREVQEAYKRYILRLILEA